MYVRERDYVMSQAQDRAEREETFAQAFGNKPGSDRRKQRRERKGYAI